VLCTVFTHELLTYQKSNEWDFWYKNNECVNTVRQVILMRVRNYEVIKELQVFFGFWMHNWKWINSNKMADLNELKLISKAQIEDKVAPIKSTTQAYVSFCFSFPPLFSWLSTILFSDKYTKLFHSNFRDVFHFSKEKSSSRNTFLVECLRSTRKARALQAGCAYKRREFWRETHTPLWLLIGRIIVKLTSFAILIGRIIFFTCEKHRSLL